MKELDLNNTESLDLSNFDGEDEFFYATGSDAKTVADSTIVIKKVKPTSKEVKVYRQNADKTLKSLGRSRPIKDVIEILPNFTYKENGIDKKGDFYRLSYSVGSGFKNNVLGKQSEFTVVPTTAPIPSSKSDVVNDPTGTVYEVLERYQPKTDRKRDTYYTKEFKNPSNLYYDGVDKGATFEKTAKVGDYVRLIVGKTRSLKNGGGGSSGISIINVPLSEISKYGLSVDKLKSAKISDLLNTTKSEDSTSTTVSNIYFGRFFKGLPTSYKNGLVIEITDGLNALLKTGTNATNAYKLNAGRG